MAVSMTSELAAPTGVSAHYFGSVQGSSTFYYWVQALYPSGKSILQRSNALGSMPAGFDQNNRVQIEWNIMAGAIAYKVWRTTTTTAPTAGTTAFLGAVTYGAIDDVGQTLTTELVTKDGVHQASARYSFAVDGGVSGLITLATSDIIPLGAVVWAGFIYCPTAGASGGSATVAVGTSAGSAANSIKTATAIASYSAAAVVIATANATPFVMTAAGTITVTIATADLTAGIFDIVVNYSLPVG